MCAGWGIRCGITKRIFAGDVMTQIGEAIAVGAVDDNEASCPFDHKTKEPPAVENKLIGVGSTLASRMKSGSSTHLYKPLRKDVDEIKNPRDVSTHPFYKKAKVVEIIDFDDSTGEEFNHKYPVTCAAHHLIPAQESLKGSPLLAYMVKKGDSEELKDESYSGGLVWADVGYDINGSENGVYLPGSYAVGGGRGGMGVWTENDDHPDLEEEDAADDVADPSSNLLSGPLNEISDSNRKWQYVSQAVKLAPGQFHDRHQDYSDFVQQVLEKIFLNYEKLREKYVEKKGCDECKKRAKDIENLGVPTPFGMVARLNGLSKRMAVHLNGSTWTRNIYTSKWGRAFILENIEVKQPRKRKRRSNDG